MFGVFFMVWVCFCRQNVDRAKGAKKEKGGGVNLPKKQPAVL
jgi:hypothetical protein